jgi:polysaccharide export outer membrane protein
MPRTRRDRIVFSLAVFLGAAVGGVGCQSSNKAITRNTDAAVPSYTAYTSGNVQLGPAVAVLAPRTMVAWSMTCGDGEHPQTMNGTDVVGTDGTLPLGPYGSVAVAGLTADQARKSIEVHLASYVASPKVALQLSGEITATADRNDGRRPNGSKAVVGARYDPAADLGPMHGTSRAQAPGELKADALGGDDIAPTSTRLRPISDGPRLHAEAASTSMTMQTGPAPHELAKTILPPYVVEPPDILLVEALPKKKLDQPIAGQHLVRPDGTINLGFYGSVSVAGMTLDQAREAVYQQLLKELKSADPDNDLKPNNVNVDVIAYNSKVYYIITDGAGYGQQVYRVPVTGNETVLDAIGQINGLPAVASKKCIWVARRTAGPGGAQQVLPVDWKNITQQGGTASNYQILPGDRLFVASDRRLIISNNIEKTLAPAVNLLGPTLLGSQTVNSIQGRGLSGTGTVR